MLLTLRVFKKFQFSSGNFSSLACDLGSLSLLSNRTDSLVNMSVPSEVHKCGEPPEYWRSKISFLRTCHISNLISYIQSLIEGFGCSGQFLLEGPYDVIHDVIACKS